MTSVSSSMPRCLRSVSRAAIGWSISPASLRWFASILSWLSHGWPGAVPELHEAHAALEQPPRDQRLPAVHARRRTARRIVLRLAADVERLGRLHLHAEGQLERLDARLEPRRRSRAARCSALSVRSRSSCRRWIGRRGVRAADVLDQLVDLLVCCGSTNVPW